MGLNIQGVATSLKGASLSEIAEIINIEVSEKLSDCTFEEALSNSTAAEDIYFIQTSNGAIIIAGEDFPVMEIPMKTLSKNQHKVVKFMYGETSMVFYFEYYENGVLRRGKIVAEGETNHDAGKALYIEHSGIEIDEVITQLMLQVSGDDIDTIELDQLAERYRYIGRKAVTKPPVQSDQTASKPSMSRTERYEKASKLILVSVLFAFVTIVFTNLSFGRTFVQQSGNIASLVFTAIIAIVLHVKKYNWLRILFLVLCFISIPLSFFALIRTYNVSTVLFQLLLTQAIFTVLGMKYIIRK